MRGIAGLTMAALALLLISITVLRGKDEDMAFLSVAALGQREHRVIHLAFWLLRY